MAGLTVLATEVLLAAPTFAARALGVGRRCHRAAENKLGDTA